MDSIRIRGARTHNLKNFDLDLPRDQLIVITGLSGSGKSSLAFDTIYAEGQRRYVESLSAYARQFLDQLPKPKVESIEGLSPAIAIEQKGLGKSPRCDDRLGADELTLVFGEQSDADLAVRLLALELFHHRQHVHRRLTFGEGRLVSRIEK